MTDNQIIDVALKKRQIAASICLLTFSPSIFRCEVYIIVDLVYFLGTAATINQTDAKTAAAHHRWTRRRTLVPTARLASDLARRQTPPGRCLDRPGRTAFWISLAENHASASKGKKYPKPT
jgi:hypothetical protein